MLAPQQTVKSNGRVPKGDIWVFGYGSLVWWPKLPHAPLERVIGVLRGYKRRFWQGSTDHRGVPGSPGRVVTLIEDEKACTWGVAYRVAPEHVADVMAYLDHREKGGYIVEKGMLEEHSHRHRYIEVLMYIGTPSNDDYLGPAPLEDIAVQIFHSKGPSGTNKEYLYKLAQAMRETAPHAHDSHLYRLEKLVRDLEMRYSCIKKIE